MLNLWLLSMLVLVLLHPFNVVQIIEISQFLLKFLPLKFREQHCGFFKLSCCTNQTSLYEHGKSKDILDAHF